MLTHWRDFDRSLGSFDELRRRMLGLLNDSQAAPSFRHSPSVPPTNIFDDGADFIVTAELPGLTADDVEVSVTADTLTLRGKRHVTPPEGFEARRRERRAYDFARSFGFPTKLDPEKVKAELVDGLLTVRLAKVPEAQPRRITVGTK